LTADRAKNVPSTGEELAAIYCELGNWPKDVVLPVSGSTAKKVVPVNGGPEFPMPTITPAQTGAGASSKAQATIT
jgi:hypothetical protein